MQCDGIKFNVLRFACQHQMTRSSSHWSKSYVYKTVIISRLKPRILFKWKEYISLVIFKSVNVIHQLYPYILRVEYKFMKFHWMRITFSGGRRLLLDVNFVYRLACQWQGFSQALLKMHFIISQRTDDAITLHLHAYLLFI